MFTAPGTAAVISSCVGQRPEGMLNLFINDRAAVSALEAEYERYFAMRRPLMRIFTGKSAPDLSPNTLLYAKEDVGAVMAKTDAPFSAFVMGEKNMINAFWDYMSRRQALPLRCLAVLYSSPYSRHRMRAFCCKRFFAVVK